MTLKVVKFHGAGCMPCKAIAPIFEKVQKELEEEGFVFESRDIEEGDNAQDARNLGARGIPTIAVFEDESPLGFKTGFQSEDMLRNFILQAARGASDVA